MRLLNFGAYFEDQTASWISRNAGRFSVRRCRRKGVVCCAVCRLSAVCCQLTQPDHNRAARARSSEQHTILQGTKFFTFGGSLSFGFLGSFVLVREATDSSAVSSSRYLLSLRYLHTNSVSSTCFHKLNQYLVRLFNDMLPIYLLSINGARSSRNACCMHGAIKRRSVRCAPFMS